MKYIIFSFIGFCLIQSGYCQVTYTRDYKNNVMVEVSINNLIKIMELPSSTFKQEILSKGYNTSTIKDDCVDYVKGSTAERTIHSISKCSKYLVNIAWYSLPNGKSNITKFVDEIEDHYGGYDKDLQTTYYQIKRNNFIYNFYIMRSGQTESVFCKKIN